MSDQVIKTETKKKERMDTEGVCVKRKFPTLGRHLDICLEDSAMK